MNDTIFIVVGVAKGKSKSGNEYTVIHVNSDFDDYMKQRGCVGKKSENIYVTGNYLVNPGDKVKLSYTCGYGGKAIVSSINVIK